MDHDLAHLRQWIGRTEETIDTLAPVPATLLAATLDRDDPPYKEGDALPPAWHWIYFLTGVRPGELGRDGHPALGKFLPPIGRARRMWAGGRLTFRAPLLIGERVTQTAEITAVDVKQGHTGSLVFVTVHYTMANKNGPAVIEEKDLVYRAESAQGGEAARSTEPVPAAPWQREIRPDPVLLFRYSALTFNGHRIHYDHPYVTGIEHYDGLIVHGPLIATLLLDLVRREKPQARVAEFSFRAKRPLFDTAPFTLRGWPAGDGKSVRLMAVGPTGAPAVEASAVLA